MGFKCENDGNPIYNNGEWWIENSTSQTISIHSGLSRNQSELLSPGSTLKLYDGVFEIWEMPDFISLIEGWETSSEENIYFELRSLSGAVLKTWKYDDRELLDRQFFSPDAWTREQTPGERVDEIVVRWKFSITENDLK
jgi:hypothetical protein